MSKKSWFKSAEKEKELSTEVSTEAVKEEEVIVEKKEVVVEKKVHVNRPTRLPRSKEEKILLLSNLTSKGMAMDEAKKIAFQD